MYNKKMKSEMKSKKYTYNFDGDIMFLTKKS